MILLDPRNPKRPYADERSAEFEVTGDGAGS